MAMSVWVEFIVFYSGSIMIVIGLIGAIFSGIKVASWWRQKDQSPVVKKGSLKKNGGFS